MVPRAGRAVTESYWQPRWGAPSPATALGADRGVFSRDVQSGTPSPLTTAYLLLIQLGSE